MKTLKSIGAVSAGFATVFILSTATDVILESQGMFPPQTEPQAYTGMMLFWALVYRLIYTLLGGFVTAKLAPDHPMRHVSILGIIGTAAGIIGIAVSWNWTPHHWYPIALAVTAFPFVWLGGKLKTNNTVIN